MWCGWETGKVVPSVTHAASEIPRPPAMWVGMGRCGAVDNLTNCVHTNLECADICATTGNVLSWHLEYALGTGVGR